MRVQLDYDACHGHQSCAIAAPEVFGDASSTFTLRMTWRMPEGKERSVAYPVRFTLAPAAKDRAAAWLYEGEVWTEMDVPETMTAAKKPGPAQVKTAARVARICFEHGDALDREARALCPGGEQHLEEHAGPGEQHD